MQRLAPMLTNASDLWSRRIPPLRSFSGTPRRLETTTPALISKSHRSTDTKSKENGTVAVFWDFENCPVPRLSSVKDTITYLRHLSEPFGRIHTLKCYSGVHYQRSKECSELEASGVSLVHTPHHGKKDVADKVIITDMIFHALESDFSGTIMLVSGDSDYSYTLSSLRARRYNVVLVAPKKSRVSLTSQASAVLTWEPKIVKIPGTRKEESIPSTIAHAIAEHPPYSLLLSCLEEYNSAGNPRPLRDSVRDYLVAHGKPRKSLGRYFSMAEKERLVRFEKEDGELYIFLHSRLV